MKRLLPILTLLFAILPTTVMMAGYHYEPVNCQFPDEGWGQCNVVVQSGVVFAGSIEETTFVTPYFYSNRIGQTGFGCGVIIRITGYTNYGSGGMVKSPNATLNTTNRHRSGPTPVIPDIYGENPGTFQDCTNIKKLILPPTILEIGKWAFKGCNLNELACMAVTPPALEDGALADVSIDKIVVPTGTKAAYQAATGWSNFTIVEGAETYSERQMVEHNGAWYEVADGKAALVNTDKMTDPQIPNSLQCLINGSWMTIPVTSIRSWAINKNVVLNENITTLPENWREAYNIGYAKPVLTVADDNPTLSNAAPNVISSKDGKTVYCVFNEAIVPHGVETIADNALNYCTEVHLPTTLNYIGQQTTQASLYFTSMYPPSTKMRSFGGKCYAPSDYIDNYQYGVTYFGVFVASSYNIPGGYEYIPMGAATGYWNVDNGTCILSSFRVSDSDKGADGIVTLPSHLYFNEVMQGDIVEYDVNITSSIGMVRGRVPEGVKKLTRLEGNYIQELYLPSTLEQCTSLAGIKELSVIQVMSDNPIFDSRGNCNAVIETATNTLITGCGTTAIPSTVERIGKMAFFLCERLTEISLGNSVMEICQGAFSGCSNLTSVYIPNSVTTIGDNAFSGCKSLTSITIPNSVTQIGELVFQSCTGLTSVALPISLTTTGDGTFSGCTGLVSIMLHDGIKTIGNNAFLGCTALTSIDIPMGVEAIGNGAFSGCTSITSINIPNSVKTIGTTDFTEGYVSDGPAWYGYGVFRNCTNLTSVIIGNGVTTIGKEAFIGCTGITSVNIPNSVKTIGKKAFSGCSSCESVSLGNSLISIGEKAFYGCSGLTSVTALNPTPVTITWDVFIYRADATLYVRKGSVEAYQAADYWKEFKEIKEISLPTYKLIYMVDGEEYKSYDIYEGESITPESEPTMEGYTFSGWSEIPETMPAHDVTVTGTFSINSYKLTYMIDNEVYKNVTYEYGATITPEPTPEGNYATFEWTDLPQTMPAHDVVVHATYTTGITDILKGNQQDVKVYSPNGKMLTKPEKGINIIRMKDGSTKKIVVK